MLRLVWELLLFLRWAINSSLIRENSCSLQKLLSIKNKKYKLVRKVLPFWLDDFGDQSLLAVGNFVRHDLFSSGLALLRIRQQQWLPVRAAANDVTKARASIKTIVGANGGYLNLFYYKAQTRIVRFPF